MTHLKNAAKSRTASRYRTEIITDYNDRSPDGVEYTLEVFEQLGKQQLCSVAPDKTLDQLKQDIGLLVPQTLVDLYGAANVETLRRSGKTTVAT